ncbi:hypothetical protein LPH56_08635 [Xylella taiwanensis]|uniref:hypothetical protein n=1 Tax=Xylella taiwanensis TaxID=1444770 RepID=UPI00135F19A0|nr:hypothetical protein [Xylella taiwanensis]UFN40911.1 hypothetical protein LPH57_09565 [Xylella taiwanensis]UFS49049.1 hypothetical protein LPH54_08620 [Xylella taiwanensis]UFS51342.1 hypothetical protein LPH56_08635 [Xylella taiwanensis]
MASPVLGLQLLAHDLHRYGSMGEAKRAKSTLRAMPVSAGRADQAPNGVAG